MSVLTDALDELLAHHHRIGSPVPRYLRPGSSTDSVHERIQRSVGLEATPDVLEVFAWHDGIDDAAWTRSGVGEGFARLFGDAHFAPLDGAVGEYRERVTEETWRPSWFPVFCGGWETYGVECDPGRPDHRRVYDPAWEPPGGDYPAPRFRDLLHLVTSSIRRFEADGYWWDPATRFLEERTDVLVPLYEREIAETRAQEPPISS